VRPNHRSVRWQKTSVIKILDILCLSNLPVLGPGRGRFGSFKKKKNTCPKFWWKENPDRSPLRGCLSLPSSLEADVSLVGNTNSSGSHTSRKGGGLCDDDEG